MIYANTYVWTVWHARLKMEARTSSAVIAEAVLEDKIADIWPESHYPCLYDVRSPDFKNRELREIAVQLTCIAEKLRTL